MQIAAALLTLVMMVLAISVCGYLFITLKRDLHLVDRKRKESAVASDAAVDVMRKEIGDFRGQLADLRRELEMMPALGPPSANATGINLNKRTQALRMMRLGQDADSIAASLNLPRNEIELLAKIQKLILETSVPATS